MKRLRALLSVPPFAAGFGLMFLVVAAASLVPSGGGPQPVAYNHSKHIAAGMACTDCHAGARTAEHATLPPTALCMGCHESGLTQSPEEAKLRKLAAGGQEIDWRPVTHVPAHVYFSHRRHTAIAGLDCAECHGHMEKLTAPPVKPWRALTMNTCLGCHEKNHARTDCNDCHR